MLLKKQQIDQSLMDKLFKDKIRKKVPWNQIKAIQKDRGYDSVENLDSERDVNREWELV